MGHVTAIEWTDHTFNPWIGCTKVSPGCANCYAETLDANRFSKNPAFGSVRHWGPGAPRHLTSDAYWRQPHAWNAAAEKAGVRRRVFCASLADVFDEEAPVGARVSLWGLIRETPWLDWQLLTKRPERIAASLPPDWGPEGYANVWLGTSVEDQKRADERVQYLLEVPARVRFLSCEPLLGAVDLTRVPYTSPGTHVPVSSEGLQVTFDALRGFAVNDDWRSIGWVITGGESGPRARPMETAWARSLRDQCAVAGVPFFFKQWGEYLPVSQDPVDPMDREERAVSNIDFRNPESKGGDAWHRVGKKAAGALLDGRLHREFPKQAVVA